MPDDQSLKSKIVAAPSADVERAIIALINRAARLADEQRYLEWLELFGEAAEYSAITDENLKYRGLHLFRDKGRPAMLQRVAFQMGLLQVPRGKTLRLVTNIEVSQDADGEVSAASSFLITRTADLEHTVLHAAGRYHDRFERQGERWLFSERRAVVDTNLLPAEFTELL